MLILNAEQIQQAFPEDVARDVMKQAFQIISEGSAAIPDRTHLNIGSDQKSTTLVMPAFSPVGNGMALSVKTVSIVDSNLERNLPRVIGALLVMDGETGQAIGLLDGASVTAIRTAAASAVATDLLARDDATSLGIIGAGVLARSHIRSICRVRSIERISVCSRSQPSVDRLLADLNGQIDADCVGVIDASEVAKSDIVCTVTSSSEPVFDAQAVLAGTHINAIGSFQPHVAEIPAATVAASRVFVDQLKAALEEAGDLIMPLNSGQITMDQIIGEIGQLISGEIRGRQTADDITLFKSVGNSVQDCLAGHAIIAEAKRIGIGVHVDL